MTSEKHERSKKRSREKDPKTTEIAAIPAVTDFCTEVRGAFSTLSSAASHTLEPSRPIEKGKPTHDRKKAGHKRDQSAKTFWLVFGICAIIVMIVCILVWVLVNPASDVRAIPSYRNNHSGYGNNEGYYDTTTSIHSFEEDDAGNDTSMEYDSVESLLTYLGNYITSEESNKEDGAADDSELAPDPGVNRTPTPSSNNLNSSESIPNAEALRYLAYVPVVIDDEEDNIQHRSSPRLQQEWRRPPPPNLNVPHSGRPVSFKDPKREALLKASLLRRFEGMRPKTGPIRRFRMPFRPRPPPVPILKGSPTQQIRSFGKEDIQHFPPISNRKVSSRNGNFADQLDSLQGEQSQMQQFSSIQDIIRHIDDRPRSRSSTSRQREKIVRPKNVQSLDSKRRYSFMMDLYPLGGKVNPMMFTEESRFDESGKGGDPRSRYRNQNRDMNYEKRFQNGGYRQRGPSVRYEEEKPEEDEEEDDYSGSEEETTATESSYAKPKGKGGKNDSERLKFQNYESNGGLIQRREWNPRPRFTIDDIIQILTAAGKIASNRRSSVLPVLPRDIWRSPDPGFLNKWNNEDSSMDLQAVESNQNRLLTKQGYWNSSNRYGYENIHNHAPEPLPDPEAATVRITSIGTRKRN